MKRIVTVLLLQIFLSFGFTFSQTNPTAQSLPYSTDFGTATFTTAPAGWAAWNGLSGGTITSQTAAEGSTPLGNATIAAQTAATPTGGAHGLAMSSNARFYVQTSGNATNGVNQLALAITTTSKYGITLSFDIEIISAQPRTVGIVTQYRVGTSGAWTTLAGGSYSQAGGSAGVKSSPSISLPSGCENQSVVQIRWATWRGTEAGNSSGIAIDNISITSTPLPITLTSFTANASGQNVTLNWNTASEAGTDVYEVQELVAGNWTTVRTVSAQAGAYSEVFSGLSVGTHTFRLKTTDQNGQVHYSKTLSATVEVPGTFVMNPAYPNPFSPQTTVTFAVANKQNVTMHLYNVLGQRVATLFNGTVEANNLQTVRIESSNLQSGTYLVRLVGENFTGTQRITLVK